MPVKNTKVEHLRIPTGTIRRTILRGRPLCCPRASVDRQRRRRPLRKGRQVNDARLVCVFIGGTGASRGRDAEMVLCAAERDADDGGLAGCQGLDGCGRMRGFPRVRY